MNDRQVIFRRAPSYYAVAASGPLEDLLNEPALRRLKIGVSRLGIVPDEPLPETELASYREALARIRGSQNLFRLVTGRVRFLGDQLFRTRISFPSNVVTGQYLITVHLVRDGQIIESQTTPLIVQKQGIDADLVDFAHEQSVLYGLAAILIAVSAGLLAGVVFRRS